MKNKRICLYCQKEFEARSWLIKRGYAKYCSNECKINSQFKGKYLKCSYCGKKIYRSLAELKKSKMNLFFCNKSCHCSWRNKYTRSMEGAANWKGGESIYRGELIKSRIEQKCSKCGITDIRVLVVHHLDENRKNNNIKNLRWLCHNCHRIVHG